MKSLTQRRKVAKMFCDLREVDHHLPEHRRYQA